MKTSLCLIGVHRRSSAAKSVFRAFLERTRVENKRLGKQSVESSPRRLVQEFREAGFGGPNRSTTQKADSLRRSRAGDFSSCCYIAAHPRWSTASITV